jgi:serine/threonine protein kinase
MALTAGSRLGPYEITALIGAGGMGEVYKARDTRLQRDVAIKVLPEVLAADTDRLARFQREAQVLASLNHPNIAAIHGLEEGPASAFATATADKEAGPYVGNTPRNSFQFVLGASASRCAVEVKPV